MIGFTVIYPLVRQRSSLAGLSSEGVGGEVDDGQRISPANSGDGPR